jgi:3-oxoadipate enol-lactonase
VPFLDVQDTRIHFQVEGPEEGDTVVLVNSIATNLSIWDKVAAIVTKSVRVLRYDARGQGASGVPEGPYSIEGFAADLIAMLDSLNLEKVHICGLSLGAMVGMWIATHHPERVGKLVLCNTAAYAGPPASWDARAATVRELGMSTLEGSVRSRWLAPSFVEEHELVVTRVVDMALTSPSEGYIGACAAIRDMDQRGSIGCISAPTLVVAGSKDMATSLKDAQEIVAAVKDAEYLEFPCGHLSNVELPEPLAKAIVAFLCA